MRGLPEIGRITVGRRAMLRHGVPRREEWTLARERGLVVSPVFGREKLREVSLILACAGVEHAIEDCGPSHRLIWTDAPRCYDWGWTVEIAVERGPPDPRRGGAAPSYRQVAIEEKHAEEQILRYSSGLYCGWTEEGYRFHRKLRDADSRVAQSR